MDKYAQQALNEYNSEENMIRRGGVNGQPFWNGNAMQFTYVPSFQFLTTRMLNRYEFAATDSTGKTHTFTAERATAPLTPIWKDIAPGMVDLKVEGVHSLTGKKYLVGARSFFKASPFPGRAALPPRARSYKEAAIKAFDFTFNDPATQYWLQHGLPDPEYYHNAYPTKMIASVVDAMLTYAQLKPEVAQQALKLATNAADYLLSITYGADTGVEGLPPTYSYDNLNRENVDRHADAVAQRIDEIMMIYPADAGVMYLRLEEATGDAKYFEAAQKIADYYKANVLPNGSWHLQMAVADNTPKCDNYCAVSNILSFLNAYYKRTGEECWHQMERKYLDFLLEQHFDTFNWEGQFEDSVFSSNYSNLTHFDAGFFVDYFCKEMPDDPEKMAAAKELMRYVEDQFVVWGEFAPCCTEYEEGVSYWYSPAVLEQYHWYVPIDSSTAAGVRDFLSLYAVTKDELLLEKACALGDAITRRQNSETGVFPTHWMKEDCAENLENFWINCHIYTGATMMLLAEAVGEI